MLYGDIVHFQPTGIPQLMLIELNISGVGVAFV